MILKNTQKAGYNKLTPTEKFAIPVAMTGQDLMACAQTGSGETASFLFPIINNLLSTDISADGGNINAFIVTPTRELAIQIFIEPQKITNESCIKLAAAYGGVKLS